MGTVSDSHVTIVFFFFLSLIFSLLLLGLFGTTVTLVLSFIMVENTCLKDLATNLKHLLEMMEARDKEYSTHFETIESKQWRMC